MIFWNASDTKFDGFNFQIFCLVLSANNITEIYDKLQIPDTVSKYTEPNIRQTWTDLKIGL